MIIVGELINGSRETIAQAIAQRDEETILEVARQQVTAGAHLLDVNAGTTVEKEIEDLAWLVDTLTGELNIPLCIDSPNVAALEVGMRRAGGRGVMINSITAEKNRLDSSLPLIQSYQPEVIALCMDDGGVPKEARQRYEVATRLLDVLTSRGMAPESVFLDPIVYPISVDNQAGLTALETLKLIKKNIPGAKTICGLSNISFGLPHRRLLNRSFLSLMLSAGLDGAILDPTDKDLMSTLTASQTLLGQDDDCRNYIGAARQGKLT